MASSGWAVVLENVEQPMLVGNIPVPLGAAPPQLGSAFIHATRSKTPDETGRQNGETDRDVCPSQNLISPCRAEDSTR